MSRLLPPVTLVLLVAMTSLPLVTSQNFQLLSPRRDGKSIRGSYVEFGFDMTLGDCEQLARTSGGNAFNHLGDRCWVKNANLRGNARRQLTHAYGGWDVYVIAGAGSSSDVNRGTGRRGGRRGRNRDGRRRNRGERRGNL